MDAESNMLTALFLDETEDKIHHFFYFFCLFSAILLCMLRKPHTSHEYWSMIDIFIFHLPFLILLLLLRFYIYRIAYFYIDNPMLPQNNIANLSMPLMVYQNVIGEYLPIVFSVYKIDWQFWLKFYLTIDQGISWSKECFQLKKEEQLIAFREFFINFPKCRCHMRDKQKNWL